MSLKQEIRSYVAGEHKRLLTADTGLVLVVYEAERINGCPGFGPPGAIEPDFITIERRLDLGMLHRAASISETGYITLHTGRFLQNRNHHWETVYSHIRIGMPDLVFLPQPLRLPDRPKSAASLQRGLIVHLGDEVDRYFKGDPTYSDALRLLGSGKN